MSAISESHQKITSIPQDRDFGFAFPHSRDFRFASAVSSNLHPVFAGLPLRFSSVIESTNQHPAFAGLSLHSRINKHS
ncbi:MAG: hypothetical protein PHQ65_17280 [Bacteroidales bacterium]|nr:hypothetical protein [Bacteroidales bacterium]